LIRVLEERPETCIVQTDRGIQTIPNTEYHKLRILDFNNHRIYYTFQDLVKVAETPVPQIFNCTYGTDTIHIKNRDAEAVCRAIKRHKMGYGIDDYKEVFGRVWAKTHKKEIVLEYLNTLDKNRISIHNKTKKLDSGVSVQRMEVIIDKYFMVDDAGTAHVRTAYEHWKHLCLVFSGNQERYRIPVKNYTYMDVDKNAMEVITKILFLMFPDMTDHVFTDQLPDRVLDSLKNRSKD
jgi:hypothetical protein